MSSLVHQFPFFKATLDLICPFVSILALKMIDTTQIFHLFQTVNFGAFSVQFPGWWNPPASLWSDNYLKLSVLCLSCVFTSQGLLRKLLTGKSHTLTKAAPGQLRLYLHWVRSYFFLYQIQVTPAQGAWGCPLFESWYLKPKACCQHLSHSLFVSSCLLSVVVSIEQPNMS